MDQVEMMIQQPGQSASPLERSKAKAAGDDAGTGFERASQEIERASQELRPSQDGGTGASGAACRKIQPGGRTLSAHWLADLAHRYGYHILESSLFKRDLEDFP